MNEQRCIICGERRDGLEVKEDSVIRSMRWFKRNVTRDEKSYRLVVCRDCFEKYKKMHDKYARRRVLYTAIGVVFLAFMLMTAGPRFLAALLYGALVVAFMYALSLLSYSPALKMRTRADATRTKAAPARKPPR